MRGKIVEMMEDMDSLDDKLFGNAFKKNPSVENGKKRITFADYNEDDPLADLLSDKKDLSLSQKYSVAIKDKRNALDNLFDVKHSNESLSKLEERDNSLLSMVNDTRRNGLDDNYDTKHIPSTITQTEYNSEESIQQGKSVFSNHKDIADIDKLKSLDNKSKKLSLMQDLFGDTLHNMSSSKESNANKKSAQLEQRTSTIQYTAEASKTQTSQSDHTTYAPTSFGTREPRRNKRTSGIINDPLGLLSLNTVSDQIQQSTAEKPGNLNKEKAKIKEYLPEWLEIKETSEDKDFNYIQGETTPIEELFVRDEKTSSGKNIQKPANMQQQKDESKIVELLPQVKGKLLDDHKAEISEQRVENSKSNIMMNSDMSKNVENTHNNFIHKEADYENLIQKLQLEKSHLTVTIHTLSEKYENEIMILDESYKRQIGFLQERTDTLEKRMQQELECLETDYEAKIEKLKNEKMQIEMFYKEEMQKLKKEHTEFIEDVHERHSQNIRLLQKEHSDTIESILKMREVENLAMTTIVTHKTDLQNLLQKADFIIENIKNVQEKTDQKDSQSDKLREYFLKSQEEDVQIRKIEMKKQQELLEQERDKMMKIANNLDTHVSRLVVELEEKSTMLNGALETLKKREQFLSQEREVFEEKVKWERNHLQALKESWFNEQEKQLKTLTKENEIIATKKRQYEILRTIQNNSDDVTKLEVAAAIKTAQDATVLANQERSKWQGKVRDLEIKQQHLQEKEHRLLTRAQDLENFTQIAFAKNEEAAKALKEVRHIENEHKSNFEAQLGILTRRQHKTAEKLNLASETLALRSTPMERFEGNAKIDFPYNYTNNRTLSHEEQPFQVTTHFTEVVDPQLVMLKLNLDDQLDNIQYMTAMKLG